jgi:hypothetical protein
VARIWTRVQSFLDLSPNRSAAGNVWIDGDGEGRFDAPRAFAPRVVGQIGEVDMTRTRIAAALLMIGSGVIAFSGVASAAGSNVTRCEGQIGPGSFNQLVVPANTVCFATGPLDVRGGLTIDAGATFVLGSEDNPTPTGTIRGGVHATNAANVQIHFATILGGVDIQGGSGPFFAGSPFCMPECITFNTIEDSTIKGGATINGYDGFWMGFIRNTVSGSVNLTNNHLTDPDGNEYVTNSIRGSLNCSGNLPPAQIGDSEGQENVVTGAATGECADLT